MKKIIAVLTLFILSGCCLNQYEQDGISWGLECVAPSKSEKKGCDSAGGDSACAEQVKAINKSIEKNKH